MFNKFLRENNIVSALLAVLRVYLGYAWFSAGLGKIQSGAFDASGFIKGAIANPVKGPDGGVVYGWYVDFLQSVALPNIDLFNVLVPWGELLVGLGLMLGCLTSAAMFFGLVLNFSFFFAGTVSHNPSDILFGFIILAAGANAGKYGLDRWVLPYINKAVFKKEQLQN
ncbi:Crp/Fnr family transcriptional regulator [Bacillus sp. FJAT-18017]|uniref:DoxX family membrane protein n=1 Tax=unclassified Bacillus (in: firmicutes) TaxID=185979 RepID=UPI0005C5FFD2|nr:MULTISPECIES: DoxX family membrane protein [unclassified Bacillus (in: firmicutes)]ALC91805.1 Crp/Fnr family transcriptional regulator [Bacillus sp. FJAT-18017]